MSKVGVLPDLCARRSALLNHSTTLLVDAGAGSGKTALMAGRVALLLAAGSPTREIVAITFTEAAASELRERIEGFVNRLARADIPDELRVSGRPRFWTSTTCFITRAICWPAMSMCDRR
jgi:ATP-dependent exoDNAse (exonuclease V) beta subunit